MFKDIDYEISRLKRIKEEVTEFNHLKKLNPNVEAITNRMYHDLEYYGQLNENTIYCVYDDEIAQYIDGCIV